MLASRADNSRIYGYKSKQKLETMKNELSITLRTNYNKVCAYCGIAFKSNRSTARYCCDQHGSLFRTNGPNEELLKEHGVILENKAKLPFNVVHTRSKEDIINHGTQELSIPLAAHDPSLLKAYRETMNLQDDYWSTILTELILRDYYKYSGSLPGEKDCILEGNFLIKHCYGDFYKIRPIEFSFK